ncbi:MAG: HAMP domain-containing histidine kinase [Deltaproteobacteria bacterium]|nr:HAMP domain-containing histidine kinase [Deltaproteobacteria bacterium]
MFVALAVPLALFFVADVISDRTLSSVQNRAREIGINALPSIEYLGLLRANLTREQLLLERHAHSDEPSRPALASEVQAAQKDSRKAFNTYLGFHFFPGEKPQAEALAALLDDADAKVAAALNASSEPVERELVEHRVGPALEATQQATLGLILLNSAQASDVGATVERQQAGSVRLLYLLDAICILATLVAAVLVWRTIRFYLETLESQQRLLGARAEELEAFAGRVAHDILNPLNAVGLSLDLMERGLPKEDAVRRGRASLKRTHRIVEALLTFARAGARSEPGAICELQPVLEGVAADAADLAREREVTVELEAPPGVWVACLPGVLASIAGNLVTNAVKYMPDGTTQDGRSVRIRASVERDRVRVEVVDNGNGIPKPLQSTIFEPYVRGTDVQKPGIGLGLATAKRLCEAHGGRIGLSSEPGRGSTFWFELPRGEAPKLLERLPEQPSTH